VPLEIQPWSHPASWRVAERNPHLYQRDAEKIVNAILDAITAALEQGDRVERRAAHAPGATRAPAEPSR
jgi:integration host factor subunit beta